MRPDELNVFNQIVRALEREYGRSLTEDELAEVAKATPEACHQVKAAAGLQKRTTPHGTHMPDFDALYRYKDELDRRLLGDSSG